jgi:P27 family predicted phage terminase small subunit
MRGNPSKRPMIREEPRPDSGASCPSPPSFLGIHAKQEWARLGPELHRRGLLTTADESTFAVYCQAVDHWATAEELARKRDGAEGRILAGIARQAAGLTMKIASLFGATPIARSRLGMEIGGHDPAGNGKFGGLLAERASD